MNDGLWVLVIFVGTALLLFALVKVALWLHNKATKYDDWEPLI